MLKEKLCIAPKAVSRARARMLRLTETALVNNTKQVSYDESALQEYFRCKDVSDLRFLSLRHLTGCLTQQKQQFASTRFGFRISDGKC